MERNDIIKALECCSRSGCSDNETRDCPLKNDEYCASTLPQYALALIKELTVELEAMRCAANSYKMHNKKLTEENERLRGILLQFTDIVHKWGNKNGYDTSEISLVPIVYEANTIKSQIVADTVRKIKDRLINYESYDNGGGNYVVSVCDIRAVAKEELEGE